MNEAQFNSFEDILNADMDDLEDLPPMGVPPSGNYLIEVTTEVTTAGDENKPVVKAHYLINAVNQLTDETEAAEVAPGQTFTEFFFLLKKDGTPNKFAIGYMKKRLAPFASMAATTGVRDVIEAVNKVHANITIKRRRDKKDPDNFRFDLTDIIPL